MTSQEIANSVHGVYFGGNWTSSNLKKQLETLNLKTATHKIEDLNTILDLVFHIHYYIKGVTEVLRGGNLTVKDEFSYQTPILNTESEWSAYKKQLWEEAQIFIDLIKKIPDEKLNKDFTHPKYGNYYQNLTGIIEHTHYHLGQIALLKKLILKNN